MKDTKTHKGEKYDCLNGVLTFDIETVPNEGLIERHMPEFTAPSNYKDPYKIEAYIAEAKAKFVDGAPLDLDYAQVHALGLGLGSGDVVAFQVGQVLEPRQTGHDWFGYNQDKYLTLTESDLLSIFWTLAKRAGRLAGYNIVGFDIPVLLRRSWAMGIEASRPLFNLKPWDDLILDIMRALYHNGYGPGPKYRGLKEVCKIWDIPNPLPKIDGSMYSELSPEKQLKYVANDVEMTRELIRRTKGYYW